MVRKASVKGRIGGFLLGHLCVCAVMAPVLWPILQPAGFYVQIPLCLAGYFLLGFLLAKLRRWEKPTRRVGFRAVALPALVISALVGVGLVMGLCFGWESPVQSFGLQWLLSSMLWAPPSFMMLCLALVLGGWGIFAICFVPACLLPPLLFHLGALLGGKAVDNSENCDILS